MAAPTQFAMNTQLPVVGGPVLAAALPFLVGTVTLFATTAVLRRSVPETTVASTRGGVDRGLLGTFFVCASVILTPASGRPPPSACS
jgi:uncharacterized membrane protein YdcZ (DUF606 family)